MRVLTGPPRGMKRVYLQVAPLLEGSFLALPASLRGYWCQLQVYCSNQENGGRIASVKRWTSQHWRMILGAGGSLRIVARLVAEELAAWDGDDLVVAGYDADAQRGYEQKRLGGKAGGIATARRKAKREAGSDVPPDARATKPPSNAVGIGRGSAVEEGGEEARTGRVGIAGTGEGKSRQAQRGEAADTSDALLSEIPGNSDEATRLFVRQYLHRFGVVYNPTAADTMGMRANWDKLEPSELPDRISTYLESDPAGASVSGFLGWLLGLAWQQGAKGRGRS